MYRHRVYWSLWQRIFVVRKVQQFYEATQLKPCYTVRRVSIDTGNTVHSIRNWLLTIFNKSGMHTYITSWMCSYYSHVMSFFFVLESFQRNTYIPCIVVISEAFKKISFKVPMTFWCTWISCTVPCKAFILYSIHIWRPLSISWLDKS